VGRCSAGEMVGEATSGRSWPDLGRQLMWSRGEEGGGDVETSGWGWWEIGDEWLGLVGGVVGGGRLSKITLLFQFWCVNVLAFGSFQTKNP
jgi:uncharacterized membrane protein YoaK (UPF0700 family)